MRARILSAAALLLALPAAAGLLSGQGVAVLDSSGAQRAAFSSNETIGFTVAVYNGAVSANRISFQFSVVAPNGNVVFRHVGNSVRGTVGNAASTVSGFAVSRFAQGPGTYTLKATASLDGVTVEQDQTFVISSPNLLLIYPPNGSQNLTDNPLTFQWYSSGAASYRVTVGQNPSLYNAYFVQTTPPGANSLTYPQNPTDTRERLSTGQIYYWNVVGLDANGNVVAQSQVPFSFSVANAAQTRDLAVTGLSISGAPDAAGNIPFVITIADQGNTTETNTPLRVTVGGLTAAGTPITVPQMSPGDVKTFNVSAPIPTGMSSAMAIACLTIFDDNVPNNCMTLTVNQAPALSSTTLASQTTLMTADQIWQAIEAILQGQGIDLSQYNLINMEGSLTQAQLLALLQQLQQGTAQTALSGPPPSTSLGQSLALNPVSTGTVAGTYSTEESTGTTDSAAEAISADQIWQAISQILKRQGTDLTGYDLVDMEGSLTQPQLLSLLSQLGQGSVQTTLSGPPLAPSASALAQSFFPTPVSSTAAASAAPETPSVAPAQTWSGVAAPMGPRTVSLTVTNSAIWARLWKRLSPDPVPDVDFNQYLIVAIVAGAKEGGDRIDIDSYRQEGDTLVVSYRIVAYARPFDADAPKAAQKESTHYFMGALPRTVLKVKFNRIKEN